LTGWIIWPYRSEMEAVFAWAERAGVGMATLQASTRVVREADVRELMVCPTRWLGGGRELSRRRLEAAGPADRAWEIVALARQARAGALTLATEAGERPLFIFSDQLPRLGLGRPRAARRLLESGVK
jgi:hypothetical protein